MPTRTSDGFESGGTGIPYFQRYDFGATNPSKVGPCVIHATGTLVKGCATTPLTLLTEAKIGSDRKIVAIWGTLSVTGATAWTDATATKLVLQDTAGTPVVWANLAKAALTANAMVTIGGASWTAGAGANQGYLTTAEGLVLTADADFAAGSDIFVNVFIQLEPA